MQEEGFGPPSLVQDEDRLVLQEDDTVHQEERIPIVVADRYPSFAEGVAALAAANPDLAVIGTASDAAGLLSLMRSTPSAVVVLDLHLPDEGGVSLTKRIRDSFPGAAVLLLASGSTEGASSALAAGARGLISKGCGTNELFAAIRSIAAGGVVLAHSAAAALSAPARDVLTPTDIQLLERFIAGLSLQELSKELLMSESTVKRKLAEVQRKLGARNRLDAIARAARMGLV